VAISAVVTNGWREILARVFARDITQALAEITRFKIGEGGSSGGSPITPDATFTDLESEGEALSSGGTAIFTNGSTAVVGSGTSFSVDLSVGEWIKPGPTFVGGGATPQSSGDPGTEYDEWGEILTITDNENIVLASSYTGVTTPSGRQVRKASEPLYTFRKDFSDGDVVYSSDIPAITEVTSLVGSSEANSDQLGNSPIFYEVGLFDSNGVMIAYVTFDAVTKISGVQLNTIVDLVF
jgi:hypothetical protein